VFTIAFERIYGTAYDAALANRLSAYDSV
jgi:hypothetical protein